MALLDNLKLKASQILGKMRNDHAARQEKAEPDVDADPAVAGSRAGDGDDGSYVGRTTPQFDAEDQESGAEARSEAARRATD